MGELRFRPRQAEYRMVLSPTTREMRPGTGEAMGLVTSPRLLAGFCLEYIDPRALGLGGPGGGHVTVS